MLKDEIEIPKDVEVKVEGYNVFVKGSKGELEKEFKHPNVKIKVDNGKVVFTSELERRKAKAVLGTWKVLVKNMVIGVTSEWKAEMKLVYSHFPVKIKIEDNKLVMENFLGERKPRTVDIPEDLKVDIQKNDIFVSGIDKERVGQLAARIEQVTTVKGYDRRVFQDGCFITKKPYTEEVKDDGERGAPENQEESKEEEA